MGLFFYTQNGSIISTVDLPTTEIIEPKYVRANKVPGVNFPPMHPRCRSTFLIVIPEEGEKKVSSMSAKKQGEWPEADRNRIISKEVRNELTTYANRFGIKLQGLKNFDGDPLLLKEFIEEANNVLAIFPNLIFEARRPLTLSLAKMSDDDFGISRGHVIELNKAMFRDKSLLERRYQALVEEGWFAKGTTYKSIIHHEMGHIIDNKLKLDSIGISERIAGAQVQDLMAYIEMHLSEYASSFEDGIEIPSEALSSFLGDNPSSFALQFVREMLKYR